MLFQRTDSLHQCTFEVCTDTHDLSGCLHLGCQCSLRCDELIKRQTRHLNYAVVKRLEACISFTCNGIFDFIQCVTKCNLGRNLGNRITCCLGSQCRGTAYTGIYFDNTIFKTGWMQCELYVTSTCDI